MERIYSSSTAIPKPEKISDDTLTDIGRLVRACAEIEDIVLLRICALTGIQPGQAIVLLGRSTISKKLEIASYLSSAAGEIEEKINHSAFAGLSDAIECRNAMVHGTYLGVAEDALVFLTASIVGPDKGSTMQVAVCYKPKVIGLLATALERVIPKIEEQLRLSAWRKKRLRQVLEPHPKGRKPPSC